MIDPVLHSQKERINPAEPVVSFHSTKVMCSINVNLKS